MFLNQLQQMEVSEARALQQPVTAVVQRRLHSLSDRLEKRDYLEDEFSAADLLMTTVLRILRTTDLVRAVPALHAFQCRCEARPAFQRAFTSQMTAFRNHGPSGLNSVPDRCALSPAPRPQPVSDISREKEPGKTSSPLRQSSSCRFAHVQFTIPIPEHGRRCHSR